MVQDKTAIATIGEPIVRREDDRFLTGAGQYTDDIDFANQCYVFFLRSTAAHGEITVLNTSQAESCPGVVRVFTGDDFKKLGGLPCGWQIHSSDGQPMKEPRHPILADAKVRYVGEPIAAVVADSLDQAKDAAEKIVVEIKELPVVVDLTSAIEPTTAIHDQTCDNICFDWQLNEPEPINAAFETAAHVAKIELINNRLIPNAIEPRSAIGLYNHRDGRYTLYTTSQNPHLIRLLLAGFVLGIAESKVRVVAPDVGGGFGSKIFHYGEEAFVAHVARVIGRPVKWTSERAESFLADAHGRDHVTTAELAFDDAGCFLALKVSTIANMGAYLSTFAPCIPTWLYATLLAGQYRTPLIHARVRAVFTNTTPVDAYRGAGRPEAAYLLERLVNSAAAKLGIDQAEIRRRNFIRPDQYPYNTPVALVYDSGDYPALLDKTLRLGDYENFEQRRKISNDNGLLRGIGLSCYIEACGIAPSNLAGVLGARAGLYEVATIRVNPTGSVTVLTGAHSQGQGHETSFAQVVSSMLGIAYDQVEIVHGDTDRIPFGMGTYGSRSLAVGGSAIVKALDKIIAKGTKIAAHLFEVDHDDIEFSDGQFSIPGTDKQKTFGEIALAAYVPHNYPLDELEPGLEETAFYDPKNFTFPAGAYLCEVEVDPKTGEVTIVNFCAVDDFGNIINPMIVTGQIHGGIMQGIGQALIEHCVYDQAGQLLTGSYSDYAMPHAVDAPPLQLATNTTICTHNPLGVKGCGEAGAIGSPPAVVNAVLNALAPYKISHLDMPLTPYAVWQALNSASQSPPQ